jgi:3-dehydroquinate synthase
MVELGSRSYPIHIGSGILGRSDMLMPHVGGRQVMVVTNETIAPLYLERLRTALVNVDVHVKVLPVIDRPR